MIKTILQCDFCFNLETLIPGDFSSGWFSILDYKGDKEQMCSTCYIKLKSKANAGART